MADLTAYERILDRLDGVRRNGNTAAAKCSAHEDTNPSLSLRAIEGQTLLHCFAGCAVEDVLSALGLGMGDLYDDPKGASYNYADGRIVHRTAHKRFRQSGNTSGTTTVLYRVEKVIDAVRAGRTVYVVEGEKDVHAVESLDATGTTNPMGSKNWPRVDVTPLHSADVVVIPDRDPAGRRWAQDVLATLDGKAKSIRLALPKVGKDAADHVAAGHTLEDLEPVDLQVDHETPARRITLTAASTIHRGGFAGLGWAESRSAPSPCSLARKGSASPPSPTGSAPGSPAASYPPNTWANPKPCSSAPPKTPGRTPSCPGSWPPAPT